MAFEPRTRETLPLTNERAAFRRRVGDWRIFFDVDDQAKSVFVVAIERRTSTTYRKR